MHPDTTSATSARRGRPAPRARRPGTGRHVGAPAAPVADRGTVLLMVLGVLALLSIIAVVYATVGRADRTTGATLVRQQRLDDNSNLIAQYIAAILGDDRFAVYDQQNAPGAAAGYENSLRAETFDYPGTDPQMRSQVDDDWASAADGGAPGGAFPYPFNPAGSYGNLADRNGDADRWASDRKRDPRGPSDPYLSATDPQFLRYASSARPGFRTSWDKNDFFNMLRDWAHISNVGPSGNFINQHALRNNFRAEPGFGLDADGRPQLSAQLSLYDLVTGEPLAAPAASNADPNRDITSFPGRTVKLNRPSDWSTNQYHAFRPMAVDEDWTYGSSPADPEYLFYQWADADGDGFADARWSELVDISNRNSPRSLLPFSGRARFFVATRVVDLGALVNVNTASDFKSQPQKGLVNGVDTYLLAGRSPADVDLLRLLRLDDLSYDARGLGGALSLGGYAPLGSAAPDYSGYDDARAATVGDRAYRALRLVRSDGVLDPVRELDSTVLPVPFHTSAQTKDRAEFWDNLGGDLSGGVASRAGPTDPLGRPFGTAFSARYSTPFGLDDGLELWTFRGVNDSSRLSRLEQVFGGRDISSTATESLSPLRENRPTSLELAGRDTALPPPNPTLIDRDLYAWYADIRRHLTPVNGAAPIIDPLTVDGSDAPFTLRTDTNLLRAVFGSTDTSAAAQRLKRDTLVGLFRAYADCLLPYTDDRCFPNAWDIQRGGPASQNAAVRNLAYGGDPELASLAVAHMAVNAADAMDYDGADGSRPEPTAVTLVLDRDEIGSSPTNEYPWETRLSLTSDPSTDHQHTADDTLLRSRQVNIFGIEAQPFLIGAASYVIYSDADNAAGGEDNDPAVDAAPPGAPVTPRATIETGVDLANDDFVVEVVAFQLHNPFDTDITLLPSTGSTEEAEKSGYYIEYAGRHYLLAQQDLTAGAPGFKTNAKVEIPAGRTVTFFATYPADITEIDARLNRLIAAAPGSGGTSTRTFTEWLEAQFGTIGTESFHVPMINPTVTPFEASALADPNPSLFPPDFSDQITGLNVSPPDRRVAYLWRVLRNEQLDGSTRGTSNHLGNDYLVDRLRDPTNSAAGVLYENRVAGGASGDEEVIDGSDATQDDEGLSICLSASIRRPTLPLNGATEIPIGIIPPWCLEAKLDNEAQHTIGGTPGPWLNAADQNPSGSNLGDVTGYQNNSDDDNRYESLEQLMADMTGAAAQEALPGFSADAEDKTGNDIPVSPESWKVDATGTVVNRTYLDVAPEIHRLGRDRGIGLFARPGDMLLPLAVGPSYEPNLVNLGFMFTNVPVPPTGRDLAIEANWTTLSEALALATGYYSPNDSTDPFYRAGFDNRVVTPPPAPADLNVPRFDRGHLALDAWVPHISKDNDAEVFDPEKDVPLGNGIPLALNVLDRFAALNAGDYDTPVPGQVNLNTASRSVARLLPMFTPYVDPAIPASNNVEDGWLVRTGPNGFNIAVAPFTPATGSLYDPFAAAPNDQRFDEAALLEAYRDKISAYPRANAAGANPVGERLDFGDDNDGDLDNPPDGRALATHITGLRETRGLRSVGELMCLRRWDTTGPNPKPDPDMSITRFAHDGKSIASTGLESTVHHDPAIAAGGLNAYKPDQIPDDYDEQLTIANAVLNSVTVRSDVFCVWFLIHGYTPEDVQVDDDQPLVPSIAKRYVMVVDRSNVLPGTGAKPRILMLQEVPVR